jgi:hypothetical protein
LGLGSWDFSFGLGRSAVDYFPFVIYIFRMGAYQITLDPDGLLRLHMEGEFTTKEFLDMLAEVEEHLNKAAGPIGLLMTRRRFGFPPTEGQVEAGKMFRHPNLRKLAVVGTPLFGGAVSGVISSLSKGKYFHYFQTEAEARAFLLDPNTPDEEG